MPNTTYFSHIDVTGKTLSVTVQRLVPGATDQYFDPSDMTFKTGMSYSAKKIALVAEASENAGTYSCGIVGLSGGSDTVDPGLCRFRVHDESLSNRTIRAVEGVVVAGQFVRIDQFIATRATPSDVLAQTEAALGSAMPELINVPGRTPSINEALQLLYMMVRYGTMSDAAKLRIYDADNRPFADAELTPSESTFNRGPLRAV